MGAIITLKMEPRGHARGTSRKPAFPSRLRLAEADAFRASARSDLRRRRSGDHLAETEDAFPPRFCRGEISPCFRADIPGQARGPLRRRIKYYFWLLGWKEWKFGLINLTMFYFINWIFAEQSFCRIMEQFFPFMWYVYILKCKDGRLYTGITTDIKRRFNEHKNRGAKFTSYNPPSKIVYTETHPSRSRATKREYAIKQFSRTDKLNLIREQKKAL